MQLRYPALIAFIRRTVTFDGSHEVVRIQIFVEYKYAAQSLTVIDPLNIFLPCAIIKHGKRFAEAFCLLGKPDETFYFIRRQKFIVIVDLLFQIAYISVHRLLCFSSAVFNAEEKRAQHHNGSD